MNARPAFRAMTRIALAFLATLTAFAAPAPDPDPIPQIVPGSTEETFKRALFDEEGRRDYPAALRGYEEVVRALDDQRRLAATAVFRLGECYRKLGRTNDAVAQYQRLLRDFAGEDTLATLCRQNLAGLGVAPSPTAAPATLTGVMSDPQSTSGLRPTPPPGRGFDWFLGGGPGSVATPAEADEIRRLQSLVDRSPDLLNAVQQEKTPLADAAEKGQLAVVRFLLDHGANPKSAASRMGTALHYAALAGHKAIVELLLERGTPVDAAPGNRTTALHWAAGQGFRGIVEVLLDHGADPNVVGHLQDPFPRTPLGSAVLAGHAGVAELLLARGADPNRRRDEDLPALALTPTLELVRLLLEHRADPNLDSGYRLMKALLAKDEETATVLLEAGANPNLAPKNAEGLEPIFEISLAGESHATKATGRTPLYVAVSHQTWKFAELLLRHGADIQLPSTPERVAPIHLAAIGPGTNVLAWVLDHGGNPNLLIDREISPLELTRAGTPRLLSNDTATDAWNRALLLLARGADPARPYRSTRQTFIHYAVTASQAPNTPDALSALSRLSPAPNVDVANPAGITPLMQAAAVGNEPAVKWLLKCGARVEATDHEGASALFHAAARRQPYTVRLLLAAGADPNQATSTDPSWTPITFLRDQQCLQSDGSEWGILNLGNRMSRPPKARKVDHELLELLGGTSATNSAPASEPATASPRSPLPRSAVFFGAVQGTAEFGPNEAPMLTDAILASGYSNQADLRRVRVHHHPDSLSPGEPAIVAVDVAELLRSNDRAKDIRLRPGDRIEIPKVVF